MNRARSLGIVTLVTLLIWFWAEVSVSAERARPGSEEHVLESMPVLISAPAQLLDTYRLEPEVAAVPSVRVRGSRAVIDALKDGREKASLTLEFAPGAGQTLPQTAELIAEITPASLGLVLEGPPIKIVVRITKR